MSLRVRVITIESEGADVMGALHQLAGLFAIPSATLLVQEPAPPALAVPRKDIEGKRTRGRRGALDEDVLLALKFQPLSRTEIADAMCRDKREAPRLAQRLFGVLNRLKRDGQIKKSGRAWALK